MQAINTNQKQWIQKRTGRFIPLAIILLFLIAITIYGSNTIRAFRLASKTEGTTVISQADLEQRYGLRVNLVALTAAGGMVDLRLKITDGEKSKQVLADKENFPVLLTEQGVRLIAPEETTSQEIQFVTGGNLFIIYPNSSNAIKPGTPVTILFGTTAVEPLKVK
jgi:hypothetical protein